MSGEQTNFVIYDDAGVIQQHGFRPTDSLPVGGLEALAPPGLYILEHFEEGEVTSADYEVVEGELVRKPPP